MGELGCGLVAAGALVALVGVAVLAGDRLGLGRLPGDLRFGGDGFQVHLPLATCLVVSLVATLLFNLFVRR